MSGAKRIRSLWLAAFFLPAVIAAMIGAAAASASTPPVSGSAAGGPGAQSYLDSARKDCFGTARDNRSKVWFTVADGVLSDVFSPTIENSNVNTLQYVVTDGRTFSDLQQRDMTYSVSSPDGTGMACRVTSRDDKHGFELVSDYITDPARASVLVRTTLKPLTGASSTDLKDLKVYVRYDATIDNTGGGGATNANPNDAVIADGALISSDTEKPTGPFAAQVVGALAANRPFRRTSSGFVGTPSDGLSQLDTYHRLRDAYRTADAGNVVQTALVNSHPGRPFTLALGFGPTAADAAATAHLSASAPYAGTYAGYVGGWQAYDNTLQNNPERSYYLSANVIKAAEDKTYLGAFVASPSDPWGQAVPATTTHAGWTYREVFARDSYETFTGLLADGDRTSAREMVSFMFDRAQQPDGSFPRDSEIDGSVAPDLFGLTEIDETAYPLLMAWQAGGFAGETAFYDSHVRPAADYIVAHGPSTGAERWEEHPGYSPSTIAAEIAGLVAASKLATAANDPARAQLYLATADDYQRNVKAWTVTTTGPYASRYFIRQSPSGNPNAVETYNLGNGSLTNVDQRQVIDAGFLELTRLGELPANDVDVQQSLRVVDQVLESTTSSGPGWHRYGVKAMGSTDGYGDCYASDPTTCSPNGAPWFGPGTGSGHLWPTLSGERAEQDLQTGEPAAADGLAVAMHNMAWGLGLVPEQAWENPDLPASPYGADPPTASIGFSDGKAAGSATPLIWAQSQYLRLLRDLQTGRLLDQPMITHARYVASGPPATLPLSVTSPAAGSRTQGANTVVTGTTTPGADVAIASSQPASPAGTTTVVETTADSNGNFSATAPTPTGADVITVAVTKSTHASGWTQESVVGP